MRIGLASNTLKRCMPFRVPRTATFLIAAGERRLMTTLSIRLKSIAWKKFHLMCNKSATLYRRFYNRFPPKVCFYDCFRVGMVFARWHNVTRHTLKTRIKMKTNNIKLFRSAPKFWFSWMYFLYLYFRGSDSKRHLCVFGWHVSISKEQLKSETRRKAVLDTGFRRCPISPNGTAWQLIDNRDRNRFDQWPAISLV